MAAESTKPRASASESPKEGGLRAWVAVVALATAFALVPRLTRGCERDAIDQEAPTFAARIVANASSVDPSAAAEAKPKLELASLRGRPVVLDFWATWCGPCQAESPIVNAISQRYKDRGLAVIGVNTSDEDGLAAHFARKKGLTFPIVYDDENAIARKYNVSSLPTLVVISKAGKIVAVRHGVTSDSELDELVRRQL